jgi:peroxiredoxin 2/4
LKEFEKFNASLLAVNTDSIYTHKAWLESMGGDVDYPVAADYTKSVSQSYGVLDAELGLAHRGVFVIDPDQNVRYISVNDLSVGRNINDILRVLAALNTKKACPVNWEAGAATL